MIALSTVSESVTLHNQGGAVTPAMETASLRIRPGECVALVGASGAGKSTLMRMIYGNWLAQAGSTMDGGGDVARARASDLQDEPTASLDAVNRATVLDLIEDAGARGAAIADIFHDAAAREQVCDRDVTAVTPARVA